MTRLPRTRPLLALVVLAAALAGCGGSSSKDTKSTTSSSKAADVVKPKLKFAGAEAQPRKASPPLDTLHNYNGAPVNIKQLKGKVVLVTFLYTHCPDICPLIAAHLHTVQAELGAKAKDVAIIAVSTDPRRDSPAAVRSFLRAHRMLGRMDYLLGTPAQLRPVWRNWNVIASPDAKDPNFINHSSFVYGIDTQGRLTTLYPANFKPGDIVHDVPLLDQ